MNNDVLTCAQRKKTSPGVNHIVIGIKTCVVSSHINKPQSLELPWV